LTDREQENNRHLESLGQKVGRITGGGRRDRFSPAYRCGKTQNSGDAALSILHHDGRFGPKMALFDPVPAERCGFIGPSHGKITADRSPPIGARRKY
jgi:hypothetical protein